MHVGDGAGSGQPAGVAGQPGRTGASAHRRFGRWHWELWLPAVLVVLAGGAAAAWFLARPGLTLVRQRGALARVQLSGVGGRLSGVHVTSAGHPLVVSLAGDRIVPKEAVAPGSQITVQATLHEPGWISWLTGQRVIATEQTMAPSAHLVDTSVDVLPRQEIRATFDVPVSKVLVASPLGYKVIPVDPPSATVGVATGLASESAGQLSVSAVPESWESPPKTVHLTYFVSTPGVPVAVIPDGKGAPTVSPGGTIEIKLSEAVSTAFGSKLPTLQPAISGALVPKGTWSSPAANELVYTPSGPSFWPGEDFTMTLPARVAVVEGSGQATDPSTTVTLDSAPGSVLRLQQLLASLDYLPLGWTPASTASNPATLAGQAALMNDPQPGSFAWRWAMPYPLTSQWQAGVDTVMTTGAVMSFEDVHGLDYSQNPLGNPLLWPTLLKAVITHSVDPRPYVWVEVTKTLPETLYLWSNGHIVITNLTNTGIPGYSTQDGTFTVYLRFVQNYMSGYNPNGTYYHDLVHWISYFNGGDAVHGFPRASYGFQQSLGCVELPVGGGNSVARHVWPYDRIGTLVTVLPAGVPTGA